MSLQGLSRSPLTGCSNHGRSLVTEGKSKKEDPRNDRPVSLIPNPGKKTEQILLESISRNMKDRNTFVNSKHNFPRAKCAQPTQLLITMKPLALWLRAEQQTSLTLTLACFLMRFPSALQQPNRQGRDGWSTRLLKKSSWTDKLKTVVNGSKSNGQLATSDISLGLI